MMSRNARTRIAPGNESSFQLGYAHGLSLGAPKYFNQLLQSKSLSEKSELGGGEEFWLCARRNGPRIPVAGCNDRSNAAQGQNDRRSSIPIFPTYSKGFAGGVPINTETAAVKPRVGIE
jgi:hypothetical protein